MYRLQKLGILLQKEPTRAKHISNERNIHQHIIGAEEVVLASILKRSYSMFRQVNAVPNHRMEQHEIWICPFQYLVDTAVSESLTACKGAPRRNPNWLAVA